MKIVFNGVHERRKNLPLLLNAASVARRDGLDISLDVLGEGPETPKWKRISRRLGLEDVVTWHGWVDKNRAVSIVANADVFALASIHDLTSTVLLEAMSCGKPVVCIDHCGFSDVVDDTCGIKIPIGNYKEMVSGFAGAFKKLGNGSLRERLSEGAKRRAGEFSWSSKKGLIDSIYHQDWEKVLVNVYACSPLRGSEPGMGWNFLRLISQGKNRRIWAFVEKDEFEQPVRDYLASHPGEMPNVNFVFIRRLHINWLRKVWPPSYYWTYRSWQKKVYAAAKRLHGEIRFDCVHQLNMVGFREPGYLWKLPIPFIWGPVGGLGQTDWRLFSMLDILGKLEFFARNFMNAFQAYFFYRPRAAAKKAAATGTLITATSENMREALRLWNTPSKVLCEIGT